MDFKLSKTHLLMQEMFRKFAETEIKPLAEDMDEAEEYSPELLAKLQRYGFFGIPYSREYGGVGSDTLAYTLVSRLVAWRGLPDGHAGVRVTGSRSARCRRYCL